MNFRRLAATLAALVPFAAASFLASQATAQAAPPAPPPLVAIHGSAEQTYVLGLSDVIEVSVLTHPEYTTKDRIGEDGTIQLPYLGTVKAAGMTAAQLEASVAAALDKGGFFAKPIVKVDIDAFGSRYVTVLGAFATPGLVPVDRAYRLSEILARVGGVRDTGADYIVLTTASGQAERLTVKEIATGGLAQDPYVQPGDKIYSPPAEVFYVSGQVNAPGAYGVVPGMTLRMAIARAGGVTMIGSEKKLKLTRHGEKMAHMDLNDKVEPGDIIVIGQNLFAF
jgi:polysaccharide export outer membrane protein